MKHTKPFLIICLLFAGCGETWFIPAFSVDARVADSLLGRPNEPQILDRLPSSENFSFLVFSDLHYEDFAHPFISWLNAYLQNDSSCEFAVHCGDVTNSGELQEYEGALTSADGLKSLPIDVYHVIGNHDLISEYGWDSYKALMGSATYSFTAGNSLFIVLDSATGVIGKNQFEWLEDQLENNTSTHCFVFTHYPTSAGNYFYHDDAPSIEESLLKLELYGKYGVTAEFAGHTHNYRHFSFDGVQYYTLNSVKDNQSAKMMIKVTVNQDEVDFSVIDIEDDY